MSLTSIAFTGNSTSYLSIPIADGLKFGTGDFTIEWWQYETDVNSFPRIFSIGSFSSSITIAVSIESGTFYFWKNGTANSMTTLVSYKNQWIHFAISRYGTTTRLFQNGVYISSITDTTNYNPSVNLTIANETSQ
jgi:hypothetical protein